MTNTKSEGIRKGFFLNLNTQNKEHNKLYWLLLAILLGIVFYFLPSGLDPKAKKALALSVVAIVMWASEALPVEITGILFPTAVVAFKVVPPTVAFSGYGSINVWFILAGLLIGIAVDYSGLGKRIALSIMRISGMRFSTMVLAISLAGFVLSFLTPAGVSRVLILYPLAAGAAAAFLGNQAKGSNMGKIALGACYLAGNTFGYGILTGITPNVIAAGIINKLTNTTIYWSQWLIWFGPPSFLATAISIWLLFKIFPPETSTARSDKTFSIRDEAANLGRMSGREKMTSFYVAIALLLWATDQIHHLPPWLVAIFVAGAMCSPVIGTLNAKEARSVPYHIPLLVGGLLCLSEVMAKTGIATWLGQVILGNVISAKMAAPLAGALTFLLSNLVHVILPSASTVIGGFTPAVIKFAQSMGLNPVSLAMMAVMAADILVIFPFMQIPLLLVQGFGYLNYRECILLGCLYSVVAIVIQLIACFTWYPLTGLF